MKLHWTQWGVLTFLVDFFKKFSLYNCIIWIYRDNFTLSFFLINQLLPICNVQKNLWYNIKWKWLRMNILIFLPSGWRILFHHLSVMWALYQIEEMLYIVTLLSVSIMKLCWILSNAFLCLLRWSYGFCSFDTIYYINWFSDVKLTVHSWNQYHWS